MSGANCGLSLGLRMGAPPRGLDLPLRIDGGNLRAKVILRESQYSPTGRFTQISVGQLVRA